MRGRSHTLKLWPNWFQPPPGTPDPGITHLYWFSVGSQAKGAGQDTQEREGWPGGDRASLPRVFVGRERGTLCLPVAARHEHARFPDPILQPSPSL